MKKRILSAILTALMAIQLFTAMGTSAVAEETAAEGGEWTPPLSIPRDELPEGDVIRNGHFNNKGILPNFITNNRVVKHITDDNGAYIEVSNNLDVHNGVWFYPSYTIGEGIYKFTGYFRTANQNEISMLQLYFYCKEAYSNGTYSDPFYNANTRPYIYIGNEWTKVEFYVEIEPNCILDYIRVRGGPYNQCIQDFCIDNFAMVKYDEIPEDFTEYLGDNLGMDPADYAAASLASMNDAWKYKKYDPEVESQYEVGGIIINYDITQTLSQGTKLTEDMLVETALNFEGTHVTDVMINVGGQGSVCYPSENFYDYPEKYRITEIDGVPTGFQNVAYLQGAHHLEELGTDWAGLWCEYLPKAGVNPWLSFRMNDYHTLKNSVEKGKSSGLLSDFYYDNPHLYRVKHHPAEMKGDSHYVLDYAYEETREMMLAMINDALNRYDCYGIELDYQRDILLFSIGGEYKGLDILNQFMRDVDDLVKIYEEKYGHEIKIGIRVASTINACYEYGLDVITWAAEDIVDLIIPTGRFASSVFDTPTRIWASTMAPYDVEIAPCLEMNMRNYDRGTTYSRNFTLSTAFATNAFSQGADKIALYNYQPNAEALRGGSENRLSYNSDVWGITSGNGGWNYLTTIGSYDKLMKVDRRHVLGWDDTIQSWHNDRNGQLPKEVKTDKIANIRVPVGDVPEGATLTLKFSYSDSAVLDALPIVYVNSKPCDYLYEEPCTIGATTDRLLCYEIPVEAHNDGYMLAEIASATAFTINHVEVYVAVAPW